jgi:hypothetical protein
MAEASFLEAAAVEVAIGEVEINAIEIPQLQAWTVALPVGEGGAQLLQGLRCRARARHHRMAARASSCWRRVASSSFSAWAINLNTDLSITS